LLETGVSANSRGALRVNKVAREIFPLKEATIDDFGDNILSFMEL